MEDGAGAGAIAKSGSNVGSGNGGDDWFRTAEMRSEEEEKVEEGRMKLLLLLLSHGSADGSNIFI